MLLSLVGLVLVLAILWGHRSLAAALRTSGAPPPEFPALPSLTLVRPIKGLDTGARENLEVLFRMDYPAPLQLLFVLDDEDDPAYPVVREVVERRKAEGHEVELLLCGTPPGGRTGKLHAMIAGLEQARGELVAFSDSDTRVPRRLVRSLVLALLGTPRVGDVFAPVCVKWEGAPTAGDVGFSLLLNSWYGPSAALAAGASSDLPFIMGQLMVFRRSTIDAIGGLHCADGQLVDDMWIGQKVADAGLRNLQVRDTLPILTGGLSLHGFLKTFRRWLLFSRSGLPTSFIRPHWMRGALYGLALVLGLVSWPTGNLFAGLMALLALGVFVWSELTLHRRLGGDPIPLRHLWVALLLPLVGGAVMLSALVSKRVDWRGRTYRLDAGARLENPRSRAVV